MALKSYKKMCESNKEIERELYDAIKSGGGSPPTGDFYTKSEIDGMFDETRESIQKSVTSGEIVADEDGVYLIFE